MGMIEGTGRGRTEGEHTRSAFPGVEGIEVAQTGVVEEVLSHGGRGVGKEERVGLEAHQADGAKMEDRGEDVGVVGGTTGSTCTGGDETQYQVSIRMRVMG